MPFTMDRRLALAIFARGVSYLGDLMATTALTLRLAPHGAGAVAVLLACNLAPIVLLSDAAGRLVDAVQPRTLLVVTGCLQAAVCSALALVGSVTWTYVLVAALGAGQAVNGATWQALVPALAPPGGLARALSRMQAAVTAAVVLGPPLGGALVAAGGTRAPLLLDAASFVVLAVVGRALGGARPAPDVDRERVGGATLVRRSPVLRAVLMLMVPMLVVACMGNVVEVLLVRSTLHGGPIAYGLCGASFGVAMLGGAWWAGRLAEPAAQARALVAASVVICGGLALMGLAPSILALAMISLVPGVANGVINVTWSAVFLDAAGEAARGRVAAVMSGALSAAQLLSYGLAAALSTVLGPREVYVAAGLAGAAAALAGGPRLLRAVTGARRLWSPRPTDPAALALHRGGAVR